MRLMIPNMPRSAAAALLTLGLLLGGTSVASALGRRPETPAAPAQPVTPSRWGVGSCEEIEGALDGQVQQFLDEEVWIRPTPLGGFIFKLQGTQPFGVCSEFFNFLVTEGLYPFKWEAFTQDCIATYQRGLRAFQYDECPNAAAIQQQLATSCRDRMLDRVQRLNRYAEEVMAAYRKCHEFGDGHLRLPPPPEAGLDALPQPAPPAPKPPATPPSPAAPSLPAQPPSLKDAAGPPAPAAMGAMPMPPRSGSLPRSASSAASCCEACPGDDRGRYYIPMAPETDCRPGDARRDDLSVGAGTCANPLTEQPGPLTYGAACCAGQRDRVLYDSAASGAVRSQVGAVLRSACGEDPCAASGSGASQAGPPTRLDVSILSTGTGSQGRHWVPEDAVLHVGTERLKPCATSSFYAVKEAAAKAAAVVVFSALGAQYERDAAQAESAPGTACSHSAESPAATRSPAARARDRAAMGAALGLLTSQATGQVKGLRASFDVTGREDQLREAALRATIVNEVTQQRESLSTPLPFGADQPSKP